MARIHHQGVQQSLLHQTTATPPTECTERTEPSCRERTPTDGTDGHRWLGGAVLPQNTQNWAAWVWQGCHTLLICEHPCSSVGGSSLPEGSVRAFCGNIFSSTDGTDEHRWLGCAVLPQNTQNWAAWVWHGCHTLLICEHLCSSVGGSSLPEGSVCSVRSAGISFLPRMARIDTDCYGALFSHRIHRIHRIWQRGYGRDAIPS